MQGNSILDMKKITGYLGKWSIDEDGTLIAVKVITDDLIAQKITIGSASVPSGITLYDEITKEPYCVKIVSGAVVPQAGACGSANNSQFSISNSQSISNESIINATTTSLTSDTVATTTPIILETASTTPATTESVATTTTVSLAQ